MRATSLVLAALLGAMSAAAGASADQVNKTHVCVVTNAVPACLFICAPDDGMFVSIGVHAPGAARVRGLCHADPEGGFEDVATFPDVMQFGSWSVSWGRPPHPGGAASCYLFPGAPPATTATCQAGKFKCPPLPVIWTCIDGEPYP